MDRKIIFTFVAIYAFVAGIAFFASANDASYIIKGESIEAVTAAVNAVGGEITHELRIINAVAATLNDAQRATLESSHSDLQISEDGEVKTASGTAGNLVRHGESSEVGHGLRRIGGAG